MSSATPVAAAGSIGDRTDPQRLSDIVRRRRGGLLASAALAIVAGAAALGPYVAVYLVAVELFDRDPGEASDPGRIAAIAVGTAIALVVRALAAGLSTHVAHVTAYRVLADLRTAIVHQIRRLPLGTVQSRSTGDMKRLLHDDVEQLEEALAHGIPDIAAAVAVPVTTTALLFVVDWRLALVALASLVALVVVSAIGMVLAQKDNLAQAEHLVTISSAISSYVDGIKVIRGFLRPDLGYDQARAAVALGVEIGDRPRHSPVRWLVAAMMVATGFAIAALLPIAGHRFVDGGIGLPTLALFLLVGLGYLTPIIGLVGVLATVMVRVQFSTGRIQALLAEVPLAEPQRPRIPDAFDVRFDGVTFGYREDRPVLRAFDLELPAGSTTALVGATGAGKSTVARLLSRFWDVNEGSVTIGGVDVRDIAADDLARLVATVQQDEYIFSATLLENVRIGRPAASDAEVIEAATRARLAEVADRLPDGWNTPIDAGGGRLSGGQRQRISIARALLRAAPIIVLDEATAALDADTERATLEALAELADGRTVIAIAHRLATVVGSDHVVLLDDGTVVDQGTHDDLLARSDGYRRLWGAYTAAGGWRLGGQSDETPAELLAEPVAPPAAVGATVPDDAEAIVVSGVGDMTFGRQWRALFGRGWPEMRRRGLVRLVIEALLRSAPLTAVFLMLDGAVEQLTGGSAVTHSRVWVLTGLLVVLLAARVVAIERANDVAWDVAGRAKGDLQHSVLSRLRRVPLGFFNRADNASLSTLVTNDIVMVDFQNVPGQVAAALIQPVYAAVILAVIDWRLALAALVGIPIFLAVTVWADRAFHRTFAAMFGTRIRSTAALLEQVRGASVLRGSPDALPSRRADAAIEDLRQASVDLSVRSTPATSAASVAAQLGLVALIVVGAGLYDAGRVSASTLLLFLVVSLALYQPIQEIVTLAGYRRNQQQIAKRVAMVWDEPVLPEPGEPRQPADASVEFRNVTFSYGSDDQDATLAGVSFVARPGTVTALVGPSGAGKSTVANLVARYWDVDDGAVLIGGTDVRELGSAAVMANVATVYQEVYLFADTVRANVTLGRPDATDEEVAAALAAAQCDFVAELPDGLDTLVGEGGVSLSGGQRQRLSIARALLKDAPIVVLDEAVAAVDPVTEVRIQAALEHLLAGRTVIVVAHRLSTVTDVDQVVVLAGGRVDAVGTHDEVFASSDVYRRLWGEVARAPT